MSRLSHVATIIAVTAGVTGVLLVPALSFDRFLEHHHRDRAQTYVGRALNRAEVVTDEVTHALRELQNYAGPICTPEHLTVLRQIEEKNRYLREVEYLDGRNVKCSLTGVVDNEEVPSQKWTYPGGYSAWQAPMGGRTTVSMLYMRLGHYVVGVDSRFYLDIVPLDDAIQLSLLEVNSGAVIAQWENADAGLARGDLGRDENEGFSAGHYFVVARSRRYPMAVVAYEPESNIRPPYLTHIAVMAPIGIVLGLLGSWGLFIWRRHSRTPRNALQEGIQRKQFVAWFQPIMELQTGHCIGAEALVRWKLADGTLVPPDAFIPMAETLGMIAPITDLVIRSVFEGIGPLLAVRRNLHVSINLTADELKSTRVLSTIEPFLDKYDVLPEQVWVEAIERTFINADNSEALEAYRRKGHRVFIDDFGTGYSNLGYLQSLPIDGIKIDRSFVHALEVEQSKANMITPLIIDMAHKMGLAMIAEGVETHAEAGFLANHGVQYGQGWLYAKAMPAAEFVEFVTKSPAHSHLIDSYHTAPT